MSDTGADTAPERPEGAPEIAPLPPDPADPLQRDHDDEGESHPGADPVMRPVPND